jgi:hypothetical protein
VLFATEKGCAYMSFTGSKLLVGVCLAVGLLLAQAAPAHAQAKTVPPDGKGIVGLGLIGAELGFVLPAVAGINDTWAFVVFPVLGAAGGAAAGYFGIEQGGHTELAVASLTAGMALLIPALVITVSETRYDPEEDEDFASASSRASHRADTRDPRTAGTGMLRVAERGVAVAAPALSLVSTASVSGRDALASSRVTGAQLSVVSGRF